MEDLKDFAAAISQIAEEKGISSDKVLETVESAIAAAYKKDYGKRGQIIKAQLDSKSGKVKFWQIKIVVDKKDIYTEKELEKINKKPGSAKAKTEKEKIRFNTEKHILLKEAKKIKKNIKVGDELKLPLKTEEDYGRIAAQTAKQVILQKIREAERESILEEYQSKEGEIISGIVQRIEGRNVFFDIGKTLGILPREEQVPGEFYRPGQRLKVFLLKVEETPKGPKIFLSRAYPKLVSKLFELEVPEIAAGQVEIKSIAREAGSRTKIAVASTEEEIDPIGAAVGQRGTRVQGVINELGGEKIDIIEWSEEPEKFIANSLSPAKVLEVKILPKNKALCIVPEDQLSLAIGKDGQNVRLAAKLTGWKIDVRSSEKPEEEAKELKEDKSSSRLFANAREEKEKPKKKKKPEKKKKKTK
jgi:N utilization substance protein A